MASLLPSASLVWPQRESALSLPIVESSSFQGLRALLLEPLSVALVVSLRSPSQSLLLHHACSPAPLMAPAVKVAPDFKGHGATGSEQSVRMEGLRRCRVEGQRQTWCRAPCPVAPPLLGQASLDRGQVRMRKRQDGQRFADGMRSPAEGRRGCARSFFRPGASSITMGHQPVLSGMFVSLQATTETPRVPSAPSATRNLRSRQAPV